MSVDNLYVNTLKHSWMMALHPIVVYYKESSKFAKKLFCFISDDLEHDTEFRFEMQRKLVQILKIVPIVTEVDLFLTDVQNYKNMLRYLMKPKR